MIEKEFSVPKLLRVSPSLY